MIVIAGREYGRVTDVAEAFGVSPKTIYKWKAQGKIPQPKRTVAGFVWRMDHLKQWFENELKAAR